MISQCDAGLLLARSIARLLFLALSGFVALVIVGSFVPFDAIPVPVDEAVASIVTSLTTFPATLSRIDFVSNIIL